MAAVSSSVEKCLKNIKILQKIFDHVSEDPVDNLGMRLVNRLFDVEYLHRIRRTHRSIFLTFLADSYDMETLLGIRIIKVNERVIQSNKAEKYVKFLTETVGVRVESFRMKVENYCYGVYRERCKYHRLIIEQLLKNQRLKVLTGIEDICPKGCSECVRHARTCEEYGPLQMNVYLDSYQEPRHYKKLIVSEVLLHELANQAVHLKKTREECLEFVKVFRKPNITCSDFCLSLSECCFRHQSMPVDMALIGSFHEVYPRVDQKWRRRHRFHRRVSFGSFLKRKRVRSYSGHPRILSDDQWEKAEVLVAGYVDSLRIIPAAGCSPQTKKPKHDDSFVEFLEEEAAESEDPTLKSEMLAYKATITMKRPGICSSPLTFWREREQEFPSLSRAARHFLGAPMSSSQVERLFSKCGQIVSQVHRNRLRPNTINEILINNALSEQVASDDEDEYEEYDLEE